MKKTLSIFLALLLAFSCGLCAFALKLSDPAAVTGLTAEWSGQILLGQMNQPSGLYVPVVFNEFNVKVTLTYDDKAPTAIRDWYGQSTDGDWWVWCEITEKTETELTMTVYFCGSNLQDVPLAELPQTTFTVPLNQIEMLIDAQRPLDTLKPNEWKTVTAVRPVYNVQAFKAEQSGPHLVQQSCDGDLYIFDENFDYVTHIHSYNSSGILKGGHCVISLEADETYYIVSSRFIGGSYQVKVTDGLQETSYNNGLDSLLFWQVRIGGGSAGQQYRIPLRSFTFMEALSIIGMNLLDSLFMLVAYPFVSLILFFFF